MTDTHPTHCFDCIHSVFSEGLCANPAVATLDDIERRIYDDPYQPCPVFEAKQKTQAIKSPVDQTGLGCSNT